MLNFWKRRREERERQQRERKQWMLETEADAKAFLEEMNDRMENDAAYRQSIEQSRKFFQADSEARKQAGLENKAGEYTFICPNCGAHCRGSWVKFKGSLHGGTGCKTCNISLRV